MSERQCNNPPPANGGRFCTGESQKFWICNTDPCPSDELTFRDVQCAEGNTKSTEGPWRAFFNADEPCVLFCINDEAIVRKIFPRAKDGTPCKPGTRYTCISGICTKVGCDFVIGSDAVDDICGICNGDGTECEIVENFYNHTGQDYQEVAVIPAESRNIMFEELGMSPNMLALKDLKTNRFLLNGNHKESPDITIIVDQTEALYRHPEPDKELLIIKGPLATDKILYVCFFKPFTVGYKYRYARMLTDTRRIGMYHWEVLEYEKCSANCEGGIQEPVIGCVEEKQGKVSPSFCKHIRKLKTEARKCNEHPCKTRWRIGKWGKCHACAFQSGVRTRRVECVKESTHPGGEENLVDDKECTGPRPATRELCNAVKVCRCRRKTTFGLPNRQLRDVWKQLRKVKKEASNENEIESLQDTEVKIINCEVIPEDVETIIDSTDIPSILSKVIPNNNSFSASETNHKDKILGEALKTLLIKKPSVSNNENIENEYCMEVNNISLPNTCEEDEKTTTCSLQFLQFPTEKTTARSHNKELSTEKPICEEIEFQDESEASKGKVVKVNVGDLYVDRRNSVDTKIIEVPFKETSLTLNASDLAFEQLGDEFGDELMVDQTKTFAGKDAKTETSKIRQKVGHIPQQP